MEPRRYDSVFPEAQGGGRRCHRLLLGWHRGLGNRREADGGAARAGLQDSLRRADPEGARPDDHGGRPDPHRRAGGGSRCERQGRPRRDRARGAVRPELAAARRAGARRRSRVRALAAAIRLVADAARGIAEKAGDTPMKYRIFRFKDLKPPPIQQNAIPQAARDVVYSRKLLSVIGLEDAQTPIHANAPIIGAAGMTMTLAVCPPGQGPGLHNHVQTYETFTVLKGRFEIRWNAEGSESAVLGQFDTVS